MKAVPPKPEGALAIKGVYIGMDAAEAVRVLNANRPLALKVFYTPRTDGEVVRYQINYDLKTDYTKAVAWGYGGVIYANLKTKKVTTLVLTGELSDALFNTGDLSATSFAKQFIDSYGIPELKPVTIQGQSVWHYESPHGWSIYVSGDKTIELFKTPTRRFD